MLLARPSRIAGALCVLVCAMLSARAVAHVIEAEYTAEPTAASPLTSVAPPPPAAPPGGPQADVLTDRNVFCSDCQDTERAGDPPSRLPAAAQVAEVPRTRLPLVLVATSLAEPRAESFATIRHGSGVQGAYRVGHRVPGAGVVERVAGTYVWIRTPAGVERLDLGAATEPAPTTTAPAASTRVAAQPEAQPPAWTGRVKQIDDDSFEVERQLIRDLISQRAQLPGVRVTPAMKDGQLRGMRIGQARKDSLAAALGLRAGDVIEAIDGQPLSSSEVVLDAYGKLDTAAQVRITLSRGGQPTELDYRLR
jgi:general secretion pathway protein C